MAGGTNSPFTNIKGGLAAGSGSIGKTAGSTALNYLGARLTPAAAAATMTITDSGGSTIATLSAAASSISDADYPPAAYRVQGASQSINYTITGVGASGTIYFNED